MTPDGRLIADVAITRTGVFTYLLPDGSQRKEYRPPEEVFNRDSLQSFVFAPFVDNHPGVVTAENARLHTVGTIGENVRQDGKFVAASLVVHDLETIRKIEKGKREVSAGYHVELDETPGVSPEGERYDAIQRNIRANHVALVDEGRAGPQARIRMDAAVQVADLQTPCHTPKEDMSIENVLKERLDAAEKDARELQSRADKADADRDAAQARADKAEAERDAEKARADKAEAERDAAAAKLTEDAIRARVDARVSLETEAVKVLGDEMDKSLSDKELRKAALSKLGVELKADASDDYIAARFDAELSHYNKGAEGIASVRAAAGRNDQMASNSGNKAREAMIAHNNSLWANAKKEAN